MLLIATTITMIKPWPKSVMTKNKPCFQTRPHQITPRLPGTNTPASPSRREAE
jgi:hypothetical protein